LPDRCAASVPASAALPDVSWRSPVVLGSGRHHTAESIVAVWLDGKAAHTVRAYETDLARFADYVAAAFGMQPPSVGAALDTFFAQTAPSAHEVALGFRASLLHANLSPATINRHLAALRSLSRLARMLGLCTWTIEVPGIRAERRRAVAGPELNVVQAMLAATAAHTERQTRDAAIVWVFTCVGLRVSEVCGLTLQETDLARGTTWIRGKARREREQVPLPPPAVTAIQRYLRFRGTAPGPLFRTLGRRGKARDGALEPRSVLRLVGRLGERVGHRVWCHGLRHTSITEAVELGQKSGLGVEKVRAHSRHRSIATLMAYVDERDRLTTQRTLAGLIAAKIENTL
jgi:integrase/recombinase XerC